MRINKGPLLAAICLLSIQVRAQEDTKGWFAFDPQKYFEPGALTMGAWLDAPAGKHGFLQMKGKDFRFEDGTPVKFWGVNIAGDNPFCDEAKATAYTKLLVKYGVNAVRFHKFTWDATDGIHATKITDAHWQNFDRFCRTLREAGIYYSWSHIYGHRVMKADSARLLNYGEVRNTKFPWAHLNGTTSSLVNFADDLQVLNIELTVNMLNHINPLTGLRYADDPALVFVELQNEDNIYWGAMEEALKQTPTYRRLLCRKFSQWLQNKYGDDQGLRNAWRDQGLDEGESLAQQNVYPRPNHGMFSHAYEQALKENKPVPPHVADRATFLYEEQRAFYKKFVNAIRATGYKGVIVGSCWQAGSGITHFYNLHSDYLAGAIDRHNYFGGGGGHVLKPGKFDNAAMVSVPGSGLLSTGLQQVSDRPFQISEWMSLIPTEWTAESAPIVAAYGMGLQGWDASYAFALDLREFSSTIQSGHGVYNVTSPTQLALYPALAAMVYRGDVQEAPVIANRNVDLAELATGRLPFLEKTSQQYDVKSFVSAVPLEALAAGRVTVSFDGTAPTQQANLEPYDNKDSKVITAVTKQLAWHYGGEGYFTINTPGTKALVGFPAGALVTLGNTKLKTSNRFACIFVTSLDPARGIDGADRVLITTIARARNTGMQFNNDHTVVTDIGKAPIVLEPVQVEVQMNPSRRATLHILDHTGNRTGKTIPVQQGHFVLDGESTRAIYYELHFDR